MKKIKTTYKKISQKINSFISKHPLLSVVALLIILLVFIVLARVLNKPQASEETLSTPKDVSIYNIGTSPYIDATATLEDSNVINIYAQKSGIIDTIYLKDGQQIQKDNRILFISDNYQGANSSALNTKISLKTYQNLLNTHKDNIEIINKQIEVINTSDEVADDLRDNNKRSLNESNELINVNEDIIDTLQLNIKTLEDTNVGGVNDALILASKQLLSQFTAANNGAKAAARNLELDLTGGNNNKISTLNKEISIKQLELQKKLLDLNKEISYLQLQLARITQSLSYPTTPVTGIVQKVHVKQKQTVAPGTLIATISGDVGTKRLIALVNQDIAQKISISEPSIIKTNSDDIKIFPTYVSTQPTDGRLYSVFYDIDNTSEFTDQELVTVQIPIGYPDTTENFVFVPIDTVHQTQNKSYVFVNNEGMAVEKEISLGEIKGNFVEVLEGLNNKDQVIIDRNIINGDLIKTVDE